MIGLPIQLRRRSLSRYAIFLAVLLACGDAPASAYPAPAAPGDPPVKDFAPGVRIDWPNKTVEVEAKVVLRSGPLELFACSPRTREHESVVTVAARPMHIFQAMGLLGFEPGAPMRYDEARDVSLPPRGTPLDLWVRFRDHGRSRLLPVEQWMRRVKEGRPPEWMDWVFAGSKSYKSGRFGADADGTVICVVDFDTALITVGALKSADNELLWLEANTERIPRIGTPCTLLISAVAVFDLSRDGVIRREGKPMTPGEVAKSLAVVGATAQTRRLILRAGPGVGKNALESTVKALVNAGVPRAAISIRRPSSHKPVPKGGSSPG